MSDIDATQLKARGNSEFLNKRFDEAIALYSHGLELTQDPILRSQFLSNIAICHLRMDRYSQALSSCDDGLRAAPADATARVKLWYRRSLALSGMGRTADAVAQLQQIASHPDVDATNKASARVEMQRLLSTTAPTPTPTVAPAGLPTGLGTVPTRPGSMRASHDLHLSGTSGSEVQALMQEVMKGGGRMTAEQQARFTALTTGARVEPVAEEDQEAPVPVVIEAPTPAPARSSVQCEVIEDGDEDDDETEATPLAEAIPLAPVAAPVATVMHSPDSAVPQSSMPPSMPQTQKQPLRGVWGAGGGRALAKQLEHETGPVTIALPDSMRDSRAALIDAAVDRTHVASVYRALEDRLQCAQTDKAPPAGVAKLAVSVVALRGGRVLMVSQPNPDQAEHFDLEDPRIATAEPFKGRSWALPDSMVADQGIEAAVAAALAQCTVNGVPSFSHSTMGVAALEDFPSLQQDAWLRLTVAIEVHGDAAALEELPVGANFGWVPLELLKFNAPLSLQALDVLNVFENIPDYPTLLPQTVAAAAAPGAALMLAPLVSAPALPEHVAEALIVAAPAAAPTHPHVLLVQQAGNSRFELPCTHVARGETFAFASARLARHSFGLGLEANQWAPLAVRGGLPCPGVLPADAADPVRGMRITMASLAVGRVASSEDDPAMLSFTARASGVEDALEVWPVHMPVEAPTHRWADLAAVEELAASGLLVDGLREELERALGRAAELAVNPAPTMLGLPICVTVESLSKAATDEEQPQQ